MSPVSTADRIAASLAAQTLELQRISAELQSGLREFTGTSPLTGARVLAPRALAWAGAGRLVGWSLRSVGTVAQVTLRDGRDSSGDVVAVIDLAGSETIWLGPGGVTLTEGLYVETVSGAVTGALWLGAVD